MNPFRFTLLVLLAGAPCWGEEISEPNLPSIFATAPPPPPISSPPAVNSPTSSHIRLRIASLAEVVPKLPAPVVRTPEADSTEPIPMAPFVVEEKPVRLTPSPPKRTVLEAIRSGRLWTSESGKYEAFSFGEVGGGGHGRITLGISIAF